MNIIKSLWALLPMACLALASCSSEEATDSAQQNPGNLKPVATIDIPITATAVVDGSKTRAEVVSDNKTLVFATGDSLWVTGKLSAESANDGDTNYPYTLNGWLSLGASGNAYQNPDFVGTLKYTEYEYTDPEHGYYDSHDWPGLGDKNPVRNYDSNTTFKLHAVLKGLYQDEASWPGEVADVSQLTSLNFSNHPICQANGNSSALNEAVKKYSLLVGTADDNGIRIPSEQSRVMFRLYQKTVFLNFTVTFHDGIEENMGMAITVANNGSTIGYDTVMTTRVGDYAVANFVVPVAAGTVLNNATLSIAGYAPMSIGTNETLEAGTVYSISKTIGDRVQLWPGGPYFATRNLGARRVTDPGQYFAWGEIVGYQYDEDFYFWWNTEGYFWGEGTPLYKWAHGELDQLTKYVTEASSAYNNEPDGKYVLDPDDDAANVNWKNGWRMPTAEELAILCDDEYKCPSDKRGLVRSEWTSSYFGSGVPGRVFYGTQPGYEDHCIFLPPAGFAEFDYFWYFKEECYIQSNQLWPYIGNDDQVHYWDQFQLSVRATGSGAYIISGPGNTEDGGRQHGVNIRAVNNSE